MKQEGKIFMPSTFQFQTIFEEAYEIALEKYIKLYHTATSCTVGDYHIVAIYGFKPGTKLAKELKVFAERGYGRYEPADRYGGAVFHLSIKKGLPPEYQRIISNDPKFETAVLKAFVNMVKDNKTPGSQNLDAGVTRTFDN
jgi:hypothetical protein